MCGPSSEANSRGSSDCQIRAKPPPEKLGKMEIRVEKLLDTPSMMARYTCASIMLAVFAVWGKLTFVSESEAPAIGSPVHGPVVPIVLTGGYLISLPVLRFTTQNFLSKAIDMKALLQESMIVYNVAQVLLNGWMVYRFISAVVYSGHPFIGDIHTVTSGATFGVWVHYCDKYLEFFDTWFMVLRGKIDQISFLHIYHHVSIAWAWWYAMSFLPGGDAYFGALLNSLIHVLMYSYYALALLKIPCPWKRFLTQAQLIQFLSVLIYTGFSYFVLFNRISWNQKTCYYVQTFEMVSLFVLFLHFYSKTYARKKKQKKEKELETVC